MKTTLLLFFILFSGIDLLAQSPADLLKESNDNFLKEEQSEVDDEIPHELQKVMEHPIAGNSGSGFTESDHCKTIRSFTGAHQKIRKTDCTSGITGHR
jgi:hypothetical protein